MNILFGVAFAFIAIVIFAFFSQAGSINKSYDKTNYYTEEDSDLK